MRLVRLGCLSLILALFDKSLCREFCNRNAILESVDILLPHPNTPIEQDEFNVLLAIFPREEAMATVQPDRFLFVVQFDEDRYQVNGTAGISELYVRNNNIYAEHILAISIYYTGLSQMACLAWVMYPSTNPVVTEESLRILHTRECNSHAIENCPISLHSDDRTNGIVRVLVVAETISAAIYMAEGVIQLAARQNLTTELTIYIFSKIFLSESIRKVLQMYKWPTYFVEFKGLDGESVIERASFVRNLVAGYTLLVTVFSMEHSRGMPSFDGMWRFMATVATLRKRECISGLKNRPGSALEYPVIVADMRALCLSMNRTALDDSQGTKECVDISYIFSAIKRLMPNSLHIGDLFDILMVDERVNSESMKHYLSRHDLITVVPYRLSDIDESLISDLRNYLMAHRSVQKRHSLNMLPCPSRSEWGLNSSFPLAPFESAQQRIEVVKHEFLKIAISKKTMYIAKYLTDFLSLISPGLALSFISLELSTAESLSFDVVIVSPLDQFDFERGEQWWSVNRLLEYLDSVIHPSSIWIINGEGVGLGALTNGADRFPVDVVFSTVLAQSYQPQYTSFAIDSMMQNGLLLPQFIYIPMGALAFSETVDVEASTFLSNSPQLLLLSSFERYNYTSNYVEEQNRRDKRIAYMYSNCLFAREHLLKLMQSDSRFISSGLIVDALGQCQGEDRPPIAEKLHSRKVLTYMEDAINIYKKYQFVVAFENAALEGYVTEKLTNAYLAGAIPIYNGSPDVGRYFNEKSMINCNFISIEACIDKIYVVALNKTLYRQMLLEAPMTVEQWDLFFAALPAPQVPLHQLQLRRVYEGVFSQLL